MDYVFLQKLVVGLFVGAWLGATVAILPWRASEILALRRVGIAAGSVIASRVRRAFARLVQR